MSEDRAKDQAPAPIVPVEQKAIDFYGDELVAVRDEEGTVWVPVKPITDSMGLNWSGQFERIQRDPILSEEARGIRVTRTPEQGGRQEMLCLPLKYVRAWLFGINANRVKPEIRDKLIAYQREVIEIIDRAFARSLVPSAPSLDLAQIAAWRDLVKRNAEIAEQTAENARQQVKLWDAFLAEVERREASERQMRRTIQSVQELAEDHEQLYHDVIAEMERLRQRQAFLENEHADVRAEIARLQQSEGQLRLMLPAPSDKINTEQQATIQELVRDLVAAADARGIRLWQNRGGNNYQAVYAELKTVFRVPSYKDLSQAQYEKAVAWLQAETENVRGSQ